MQPAAMDDATMQAGLLMESVQAQSRQVDDAVDRLSTLAHGLDAVIRQEIRAAFAEEFQALGTASARASQALALVQRVASLRMLWFSVLASVGSCALPAGILWRALPSRTELQAMRSEQDALHASLQQLHRAGGHIELRHCGASERLCVRIDRGAPAYGAQGDYVIVKGY
jgi:hypothetical protein